MPAWQLHPTQGVSLKTHACRNIGYPTQSSQCLKINRSREGMSEKGNTAIQKQHRDQRILTKQCDRIIGANALTTIKAIRSYPTSGNNVSPARANALHQNGPPHARREKQTIPVAPSARFAMFIRCLVHAAGNSPRASHNGKEVEDVTEAFALSYETPKHWQQVLLEKLFQFSQICSRVPLPLPPTAHSSASPASPLLFFVCYMELSLHRFAPRNGRGLYMFAKELI
jgi:hypothetical protein